MEDERGNLKWSVPVLNMFKTQSFANCYVILPDAGVAPVKPKLIGRPSVPKDTLTIKSMFRAALHASAADPSVSAASCLVCDSASSSSESGLATCSMCLVTSHCACLVKCLQDPSAKALLLSRVQTRTFAVELPPLFMTAKLCAVCTVVSSSDEDAFNLAWAV
jgi:hypothetical protein